MNVTKLLTEATIYRILAARADGEQLTSIGRRMRLSLSTVSRAVNQTDACLAAARSAAERQQQKQLDDQAAQWRAEREAQQRARQEGGFRPKPLWAAAICPGCGGTIVQWPCILCTSRRVTMPAEPRDTPDFWFRRDTSEAAPLGGIRVVPAALVGAE